VEGLVRSEGDTTEREDHGRRDANPFGRSGDDRPDHDQSGDDGQDGPRHGRATREAASNLTRPSFKGPNLKRLSGITVDEV
jgi:hypothetical protein